MTATLFFRLLGLLTSVGFGYLVLDYNGPGVNGARAVSGNIRVEGRPLATGMIQFMPTTGVTYQGAGAFVTDGAYKIERKDGLIPGRYQVSISGIGLAELNRAIRDGGVARAGLEDPIPARFNRQSEIFVEVADDGSVVGFDFDLK